MDSEPVESRTPVVDDPQTYAIIGAALEVHRVLGRGFLESVYQEALAVELAERKVPTIRELQLPLHYKGRLLGCSFRPDFVCWGSVIVEVKALTQITGVERAQVLNYLKATGYRRGLLFNFGAESLQFERFVSDFRPPFDEAATSGQVGCDPPQAPSKAIQIM